MTSLTEIHSTAWVDQRRVVVLGRGDDGTVGVWQVEIGGSARALDDLPGAVTVTAGNGEIYAGTEDSVVYRWNLVSWKRVGAGDWPALPG
jgi:hypothetical protein